MADMGKTEVTSAIMQDVSKFVQSELKQKAKLMPLVQNSLVAPGMDSTRINRAGGFAAADKLENTSLTAQLITMAADILNMDKHPTLPLAPNTYRLLDLNLSAHFSPPEVLLFLSWDQNIPSWMHACTRTWPDMDG